jgi:hypothetical protein
MNKHNIRIKPVLIVIACLLGFFKYAASQQLSEELTAKLSSSDKQKIQKAEDLNTKGKKIEEEIPVANRDERKYQLKRLEAADFYQQANSKKEGVYSDNLNAFWKKYKGEKKVLDFAKKIELAAADSMKRAEQLRKTADKERKMTDRIAYLAKAEKIERKSLVMMQKVLYTYLSWPIEYDHVWVSTEDEAVPSQVKTEMHTTTTKPVTQKDTVVKTGVSSPRKDTTVAVKDTTVKNKSLGSKKKSNVIIIKPKTAPVTVAPVAPVSPVSAPTNTIEKKDSALVSQPKAMVAKDSVAKQTVKQPVAPKTQVKDTIQSFTKETSVSKVPVKETIVGNDSSLYGKMKVKEDQIDKFNQFLKEEYPAKMEDYVIDFQKLDYTDIDALKTAWYNYQYGYLSHDSLAMLAAKKDSAAKEILAATTDTSNLGKNIPQEQKTVGQKTGKKVNKGGKTEPVLSGNTGFANNAGTEPAKNVKPVKGKRINLSDTQPISEKDTVVTVAEGFIFRVQIVACRVPLDKKTLRGIYNGPLEILELNEDNWYKYAIGEFTTYKAARQLRDQSNIPGVFVIAYLNGKRIKITPGIAYKKFSTRNVPNPAKSDQIRYFIQIAASKTSLSDNYLKNIYNGPVKIEIKKEGEWNKYVLPAGKTYQEANETLKNASIPGAFIIVYQNDTRIELQKAIKITQ